MRRLPALALAALSSVLLAPRPGIAGSLTPDGRAGVVTALQGTALVRPVGRERWTPLDSRSLLFPGDVLRTEARGANALEVRLPAGGRLVVGPGASLEFPGEGGVRLLRGDVEARGGDQAPVRVTGPGGFAEDVAAAAWLRVGTRAGADLAVQRLPAEPPWLRGYRASTSEEWMGSLLATVDGKNVPLTVGYHKVVVEVRDQIARTTVEESFVNSTDHSLEGVFSFPLPADASISGFGMWIGDELVEADLVEKQRAREIYEDILRRKKDPGLLEWEGGNLFKARVFPIFPHAEKRIRLRYTQVLPLEGDAYRYRYALRSELLRLHPLRELSIAVSVVSAAPIRDVSSATHAVTLKKTDHEAVVEFGAQEYVPDRDFEVAVTVGPSGPVSAVAHRRGEDGFFMLLLSPADPQAAGARRDLVPEGEPLDLVLVADTSGSMDPASRAAQSSFLAALLGQLSSKDRFRLLACDVEPRWLVEDARPATEENVGQALAALDARFSLGWTDLDRAFDAVVEKAGAGAHVVYVGDGIPTAGDADPVATAGRLRARAKDTKATFHAVSTSAAYEKVVLEAIAALGGGSVRRGEQSPATAARALLAEVARPGLKDLRVEVQGLPTARVYPEILPNLPLGEQQVVLGRFLPGPAAHTASVVVTGTLAGKPVRYASSFEAPPPEGGNSFLPRLWARRHLDALLAEGQDAQTKADVVAFSREYQIMTPYTSFLVLESDEDRAHYGVERTVHMRDAERFFAAARDKASLEIARQQAETAHRWRLGLRREMLRQIADLGRSLPIPVAYGWQEGPASPISGIRAEREGLADTGLGRGAYGLSGGVDCCAAAAAPAAPPAPSAPAAAPMPMAESKAEEGPVVEESEVASADHEEAGETEADAANVAPEEAPALDQAMDGRTLRRRVAEAGKDVPFIGYLNSRRDAGLGYGLFQRMGGPRPFTASDLGFPFLEAPPKSPTPFPDPAWDPLVLKALRSLDRRPALLAMDGALRVTSEQQRLHPLRAEVAGRSRSAVVLSARRWLATSEGFEQEPTESWLSETERGVVSAGLRLGRRRPALDADRARWPLPLEDRSLEDVLRSYARSHRRAPRVAAEGDVLRIVFAADDDPGSEDRLSIDVRRSVLLEERWVLDGKTTYAVRFGDFVEVAGRSWATKAETLDEDGHVVARRTTKVEAISAQASQAALDAAVAAHGDVVFLSGTDPSPRDARQAVHDGRGSLADLLVVALGHAGRQRWDDAWKAFEQAEALASGRPGTAWMRLGLLARSRRGAGLRAHALAMAGDISRSDSPLAPWRARRLDSESAGLGGQERLDLVGLAMAAWARPGPDHDLWVLYSQRRHAEAEDGAGARRAARVERATLAEQRPFDAAAVLAHANDLAAGEDLPAAAAYAMERATKGGPWTRGEADSLFQSCAAWLYGVRDLGGLEATANAWVAAAPAESGAYSLLVSALYFRGRYADADRWILEHLAATDGDLSDPARRAALEAAIHVGLGQGWNFWAQHIPLEWRAALAGLALRLARSDSRHGDLVSSILDDWRFRQTEEARTLKETLEADILAEGAVASMTLRRLARYVRHVQWNSSGVMDAGWRRVVDGLLARWRAAGDAADADLLAGLVEAVLDGRGAVDEKIAFLRERLGKASERDSRAAAEALFDALLGARHDLAREDEAFALLPRLLDARDVRETSGARAASAARRLATWVHGGRLLAATPKAEERSAWTRAEAAQHAREARARADRETAERLAAAVAAAGADTRPWLEAERLGYSAETLADLARAEGEARELLAAVPAGAEADIDRLLAQRAAAVLTYAATRRSAPAGLADRVVALLRARLAAKDRLLDVRFEIFRLLVALDRAEDLEKDLVSWIEPGDADATWRIALAYLEAETGRVREAAVTMEGAAALGALGAPEWAALAGWYLVLKEDAKREEALDRRYADTPEWQLEQVLWREGAKVGRQGEGVPAELDPEALRVLRILLSKSENAAGMVGHVLNLYRPTKDFRVLSSLADGIVGHSPEAAYAYLAAADGVVSEIHEEATCDALGARIDALLASAKEPGDRRALRLLLVAVESRAGAVLKADPRHGQRALAALGAAFEGDLARGERTLLARHLASLKAPADAGLSAAQMERLEALLAGATEGPLERLAVGRYVAEVLWERGSRDDAADRLDALIAAAREDAQGTLLPEANEPYDTLVNWWSAMGRLRKAETRLRSDLEREPRSGRRERLRMRLFALEVQAVEQGADLSAGSRLDLFRAAAAEMERYLVEGPAYLLSEAAQHHGALHVAAKAGVPYEEFVLGRLPAIVARSPLETLNVYQVVLDPLHRLRGPLPPLAAALARVEQEPAWFERIGQGAWARFSGSMAAWRQEAGRIGDLEPRLLPRVLSHLEAELERMSWEGGGFWFLNSGAFWHEHARDFAAVAARVAEVHAAEAAVALFVAAYQRDGLGLRREAIETLQMAVAHQRDTEGIRWQLATWLREDGRFAEALPVAERLVTERPDNLAYRVLEAAVLRGLERGPDAQKVLEAAAARWKERKAWTQDVAATLAVAALDTGLAKPAAEWIEDALRLRREAGGGSGPDATLSSWYQTLARARSLLHETDAAVRAAAAAVVAWGRDEASRARALAALHDVIAQAGDLDAYLARYEAEVASSGLDAPAIRKALGRVLLERRQAAPAAAQFRAARDLDPADAETHGLLVRALDAARDNAGALAALLASVRMAPKNLDAYADLSRRFERAGDAANAERARTSLVEAMPSEPDGYRALARLREASRGYALAATAWAGVVRVRPNEPEGWLGLARAQAESGDKAAARATIQHVLEATWDARFGDVRAEAQKVLRRLR